LFSNKDKVAPTNRAYTKVITEPNYDAAQDDLIAAERSKQKENSSASSSSAQEC
jgi:hypothetical protein